MNILDETSEERFEFEMMEMRQEVTANKKLLRQTTEESDHFADEQPPMTDKDN